jgi:general secretion pathway protein L
MTLQELLNAQVDFALLGAQARRGLAWWLGELAAMLPAAWRDRLSSRPRLWIEPNPKGGWLWEDGQPWDLALDAQVAEGKVGLLAPSGAVLVREVSVARMPAADIRRMLALDIDRLSPLAPELIHFDMDIVDRGDADGRLLARLGILSRDEAAGLVARAREDGITPVALAARIDGEDEPPCFDFLPQAMAAAGERAENKARYYWWAAAALVLVNLAVLVGRDMVDVSQLQAAVEAQQPMAAAALRLSRRIGDEDARRRALLARGRRDDPLAMLDALTRALSEGAWVQRLEWNGQSLRIIGFKSDAVDLSGAIRASAAFANPRAVVSAPLAPGALLKPFDLTADARAEPRP